ncbi:MAG: hypothetical protein ABI808_02380 [Pseudonocardiales bacterium]
MRHFIDWGTATVEWTVNGHELSAPFAFDASPRQVQAVTKAVEAALHQLRRDDVIVTCVESGDDSLGELLLTSDRLLSLDPVAIRGAIDHAADGAANDAGAQDADEAAPIASWVAALRAAP